MVVSNIFYFQPYLGKIPILTNIFQRGWNHQPEDFRDRKKWLRRLPKEKKQWKKGGSDLAQWQLRIENDVLCLELEIIYNDPLNYKRGTPGIAF